MFRPTGLVSIHFIALGDFSQLKPVGGTSLADYISLKPVHDTLTPVQQGRQLWERFDKVILLTQQMRQADDELYAALLERLRDGKSTCCCCDDLESQSHSKCLKKPQPRKCRRKEPQVKCDYHLLMDRVLDPKSAEGQCSNWKECRMLCWSNPVSGAWSRDEVMTLAANTHQPVLVSTAKDERPSLQPLPNSDRRRLRGLPDNKTKSLPGVLPLVKGMRVMLRWNVATELGLTNGAEGEVVEVVLDPREHLPASLIGPSEATVPVWHQLRYQPQCVIVEFDHLDLLRPLDGLPQTRKGKFRVPITPIKNEFLYTRPARHGQPAAKAWNVRRIQIPLIPCRAMTTHMCQGRTLGKFIVDLDVHGIRGEKLSQLYVMLSRGQRFADLRILRAFHHSLMHLRPPFAAA